MGIESLLVVFFIILDGNRFFIHVIANGYEGERLCTSWENSDKCRLRSVCRIGGGLGVIKKILNGFAGS
jgi:hypothetical protein